ncbi:30S ribosomal protein S18 [Mycolicibacterium sp.]|uniref:30S ribosomal protein S18 n=1 Tax=Mycolicibacterium sp. TaxID=2320850 RepID=UPI00093C4FD0|nr:30S ribosomal protein S18 [Mycobacterium sp. SWH-M3]
MTKKNPKKRPPATELKKPRRNQLAALGVTRVDYKDVQLLRTFISERGKIRSRRVTGLTPQQQRQVAAAIKNAREMALLPVAGTR